MNHTDKQRTCEDCRHSYHKFDQHCFSTDCCYDNRAGWEPFMGWRLVRVGDGKGSPSVDHELISKICDMLCQLNDDPKMGWNRTQLARRIVESLDVG